MTICVKIGSRVRTQVLVKLYYFKFCDEIVKLLLKCFIIFLRAKLNLSIDESYLQEVEKEDGEDEAIAQPKSKKKSGRRGNWSSDNLDDFIDIIVNNDNYVEKLIFRNTKFQHNGIIYEKIRTELKRRSSERGESMEFSVSQLRNKFKKCVGECKKVALTIKTATGIKKIQREKGYGAWFDQLFALIKTRDSCKPEKATEPSASKEDEEQVGKDDEDDNVDVTPKKVHVPVRSKSKDKQKYQEKILSEVVDVVKNLVDKDPMKDLISMVREEMKQSREHDLQLYQLMFNSSAHNFQLPRQIPETPHFFQQNSYYQNHGLPLSFANSMNQRTVSSSETLNVQQNLFPEDYACGSSSVSSPNASASQYHKDYQSL